VTDYQATPAAGSTSGWVAGGTVFAATVMVLVGVFQILQGLAAIIEDEFFVVIDDYAFDLDVTAWGWIHLLLGIVVLLSGIGLFSRNPMAVAVAVVLAVLSAVANFFFIPYYPLWSLLMIGLAVWVIWSVTRPGVLD
jgi:hypothetical protein